ncbi:hypothetical protein HDU97_006152, partial [Phlyctochytrium planicorne]
MFNDQPSAAAHCASHPDCAAFFCNWDAAKNAATECFLFQTPLYVQNGGGQKGWLKFGKVITFKTFTTVGVPPATSTEPPTIQSIPVDPIPSITASPPSSSSPIAAPIQSSRNPVPSTADPNSSGTNRQPNPNSPAPAQQTGINSQLANSVSPDALSTGIQQQQLNQQSHPTSVAAGVDPTSLGNPLPKSANGVGTDTNGASSSGGVNPLIPGVIGAVAATFFLLMVGGVAAMMILKRSKRSRESKVLPQTHQDVPTLHTETETNMNMASKEIYPASPVAAPLSPIASQPSSHPSFSSPSPTSSSLPSLKHHTDDQGPSTAVFHDEPVIFTQTTAIHIYDADESVDGMDAASTARLVHGGGEKKAEEKGVVFSVAGAEDRLELPAYSKTDVDDIMDIPGYVVVDAVYGHGVAEGLTGVFPPTKDSACVDSSIHACAVGGAVSAAALCNRRDECTSFICDASPTNNGTCFLFSLPLDFRLNSQVNPQNGWIKNGVVATVKGVVTTVGTALTQTITPTAPPSPSSRPTDGPDPSPGSSKEISPAVVIVVVVGIFVVLAITAVVLVVRRNKMAKPWNIPPPLSTGTMRRDGDSETNLEQQQGRQDARSRNAPYHQTTTAAPAGRFPHESTSQHPPQNEPVPPLTPAGVVMRPGGKASTPVVNLGTETSQGYWRTAITGGQGQGSSMPPPAYQHVDVNGSGNGGSGNGGRRNS